MCHFAVKLSFIRSTTKPDYITSVHSKPRQNETFTGGSSSVPPIVKKTYRPPTLNEV